MSALSAICEYESNSDESDHECVVKPKRSKLHVPDLGSIAVVQPEVHIDNPSIHGGRKRSFPHERGNWTSFVYVKYPEDENLHEIINKLQAELYIIDETCQKCEDIHISLSKTFVLKYHLIKSFTKSLQEAISGTEGFNLGIDSIKVYCNDENTRTFIALEVDNWSGNHLSSVTKKIDDVLADYKLPQFYEDPSFHASILWINGNKKKEILNILHILNDLLHRELRQINKSVAITKLNCKIGNKLFQYNLK